MARLYDRNASPLYRQVADLMRERIVRATWTVGERIPALQALADEFEVASITIREAVRLLRDEGLLEPRQGSGTYVSARPPVHPRMRVETSLQGLADLYRESPPRLIALEEGVASPALEPGEGALAPRYRYLRRIHAGERQSNSVISAYLDERVFRLAPRRFRKELIIPVLMDLPQLRIASARQTLTIGTAGAAAAQALDIAVNAPVAELRRVFCAPDGTVIYLGELTYRGDFIRLDIDLMA